MYQANGLLFAIFVAVFWFRLSVAGDLAPNREPTDVAGRCEALITADFSAIQDAPTQVTSAEIVPAAAGQPALCRVQGYIAPQVGFELRLPVNTWNGRFIEVGCGGFCGRVHADSCNVPLTKGYACVASDMGHKGTGSDVLWARNNIQAQIDFGYRATHVAAVAGKAIAKFFYAMPSKKSYYVGCSTGGYQGIMEASAFPWDFDGVVAGAPDIDQTAAMHRDLWVGEAVQDEKGEPRFTHDQLRLIHEAVLARCDLDDGVKDGIVGSPMACNFDPKRLLCKPGQTSACLTKAQVDTVAKIYAGPTTSSGEITSTGGYMPGSELNWEHFWPLASTEQFFKFGMYGYSTPGNWQYSDFDFDHDQRRFGLTPWYVNSNPDLRKFKRAGAKLLVYHGGNDTVDLPGATIDYYETVERTMGGRKATQEFFRLFFIPGMNHCTGGDGAFAVDWLSYMEDWVENGRAPDKLNSAHVRTDDLNLQAGNTSSNAAALSELDRRMRFPLDPQSVQFTRPVYPYPTRAKYSGHGSADDATNFVPVNP
jgi:Tannase and feruloyl esterase